MSLFLLVLLTSILIIAYVHSRKKHLEAVATQNLLLELDPNPNPHAFGTQAWLAHENAQAPPQETDALLIASLLAQVGMLEDSGDLLGNCIEILQNKNQELSKEISELRRAGEMAVVDTKEVEGEGEGCEELDAEILRRVRKEVDVPLSRNR